MRAQQIAHEKFLRLSDGAVCFCDEHKGWHNHSVLRERRIAAPYAAVQTDTASASIFDLADVGDEIFRRAERINDWFCVSKRHDAPLGCVSARKHPCIMHLSNKATAIQPNIKFARGFSSTCSEIGTGVAV